MPGSSTRGRRPAGPRCCPRRPGTTRATCSRWSTGPTRRGSPSCCPARSQPAPEDPGAVALIWADWQSCGDAGDELLDPVRAQYRECFAVVRCAYEGRVYSRCVYIWVDADFALARGLHPGLPEEARVDPPDEAAPVRPGRARIGPGGTFAGHAGRRRPPAGPGGGDAARAGPGHRVRQRASDGAPPVDALDREGRARSLDELIGSGSASVEAGPGLARRRHPRAVRVADRGTGPAGGPRDHRRLLPAGRRHLGRRPGAEVP